MSNPFTQTYLRMVSQAAEVQSVRLSTRIFPIGDYAIFESPFIPAGAISQIDDRSAGVPQDNALAWLPNLAQLMDLFGGYPGSLQAMRKAFFGNSLGGYFEAFNSWEECTLAVLMLEKFQKVWTGETWDKVTPDFPKPH